MSKLTCPYCFDQFSSSQIAYRCLNPNPARCPLEDDHELGKYQMAVTAPKLNRVFIPGDAWRRALRASLTGNLGMPPRCLCDEVTKKVCPCCHNDLPSGFGEIKMRTIALIGAKDAGKSHYIAVLIHELASDSVGGKFDAALQALDERTMERYKTDFWLPIYKRKEVIHSTLPSRARKNYPLIYKFSLERDALLPSKRRSSSAMVFFDTAGEDLDKIDVMSTELKYLVNSDGIIFLLDPLQMSAVRHQTRGGIKLPDEHTEPQDIITRAVRLIREANGGAGKIKTPVAVAFSKIDAIRHLFDPGSPIHQASNHDGYFDLSDAEAVSENIKAHLSKWDGGKLDPLLKENFENYSYFGLSALGAPPDADNSLPYGVAPFRVEDPFLWILHQQGIVSGRRSG
jgi:hypothetical protein